MALNPAQKNIVRVTIVLCVLTAIEFILAGTKGNFSEWFGMAPDTVTGLVFFTFVALTILKAFYIISEFMHLGHEVKRMILSIGLPFIFLVWLLIALITDGGYYGKITKEAYGFNNGTEVPTMVLDQKEEPLV